MRHCLERCPECPSRDPSLEWKKIVSGIGPLNARVMLVGEAPGKHENRVGIPFIGATGQELDRTYLPLAGLTRGEVYITNTVFCHWADASDAPPEHVIRSCSEFHLRRELATVKPEVLVLMGGISNGLLGLPLDITALHGTGTYGSLLGWSGRIWHSYHPALGMHMGSAMQSLLEDFRLLRGFISGKVQPLEDEVPDVTYITLRTANEVRSVMRGRYHVPIGVDTEGKKSWKGTAASVKYTTWCATFCIDVGTAYLVKVEDEEAWAAFCEELPLFLLIYMHNAPHDYKALLDAGCQLDWARLRDTMEKAYLCANLPKGLKPLSYRLFGVRARNFEDVVRPYGVRACMEYFERAAAVEWPPPEQDWTGEWDEKKCGECVGGVVTSRLEVTCPECLGEGVVQGKKKLKKCPKCSGRLVVTQKTFSECATCASTGYVKVKKMTRRQGLGQKISRLITDYVKSGDGIDPWTRFEAWESASRPLVEAQGYPPVPSVELVPTHEIEDYAGLDAHSTKRAGPELDRRMRAIRKSTGYEREEDSGD